MSFQSDHSLILAVSQLRSLIRWGLPWYPVIATEPSTQMDVIDYVIYNYDQKIKLGLI